LPEPACRVRDEAPEREPRETVFAPVPVPIAIVAAWVWPALARRLNVAVPAVPIPLRILTVELAP